MRKIIKIKLLILICLFLTGITPAQAQRATQSEALTVANNWIDLIINRHQQWGGSPEAEVVLINELSRNNRNLGYYCQVAPRGFIIVSLYKSLAPVKAYSDISNLNPFVDGGLADLIKGKMERVQMDIEQAIGYGIQSVQAQQLTSIVEIDYQAAWSALTNHDFDSTAYQTQADYQIEGANYQAGQIMLDTVWHQQPPYNDDCPNESCTWPGYGNFNSNTYVGCVATAGAQIMRYWHWPPYGSGSPYGDWYDWPNMRLDYNWVWGLNWFQDENGNTVTQAEIDAVAELNYEVALAVGMNFGCDKSSSYTYDMEGVYENQYRYDNECDKRDRNDYSVNDWFNLMKNEFNQNRPIHYRITGHSIVSDGWQEIAGQKQYHMNYGWDDSYTAWYTIDTLYLGGEDEEYIMREIYPVNSFSATIVSGTYNTGSFPYRYIDQDTSGAGATFGPGQNFQFLKPGLAVAGTGSTGVVFRGQSAGGYITRFFLNGDLNNQTRIKISDGGIKLSNGGKMVVH